MYYCTVIIYLCVLTDATGGMSALDCLICTAGSYCQSYGLYEPTGLCDIGYYCPGGQDTPTPSEYACSPGHFCYQGSHNQTGCPSGDYQPHWGQGDCDQCPSGSYCKAFGEYHCIYSTLLPVINVIMYKLQGNRSFNSQSYYNGVTEKHVKSYTSIL